MHHGGAAIDNDPFTVFLTLGARFGKTGFAHGIAHAGRQGLGLAIRAAGGNNHALEQRREMLGVEHLNVLRLDVFQPINDGPLEFGDVFFGGGFGGCVLGGGGGGHRHGR